MKTVTLFLKRKKFPEFTEGKLYFENEYFCDTLENPVRELQDLNNDGDFDDIGEGKIYGDTAIPANIYELILTHSPSLKRVLPLILDVPGFRGIRMHAINDKSETLGCIGVGKKYKEGKLCCARITEDALVSRLKSYMNCRVLINIIEQ